MNEYRVSGYSLNRFGQDPVSFSKTTWAVSAAAARRNAGFQCIKDRGWGTKITEVTVNCIDRQFPVQQQLFA